MFLKTASFTQIPPVRELLSTEVKEIFQHSKTLKSPTVFKTEDGTQDTSQTHPKLKNGKKIELLQFQKKQNSLQFCFFSSGVTNSFTLVTEQYLMTCKIYRRSVYKQIYVKR